MSKVVFLCALFLVLYSCTPVSIADNKRLQVKGKIGNIAGENLPDMGVETRTYVGSNFILASSHLERINGSATNSEGD
ncbi:hypothetical protein [Zunongwangia sp. H14]|uniref:hypothetical protein n=1 Tax=Zunongwangia sp. H14 TaxID=3240792 RepID=UPI003568D12E